MIHVILGNHYLVLVGIAIVVAVVIRRAHRPVRIGRRSRS